MKNIGPTFGDEVHAAGLGGLPFAWGSDGAIDGRERLTKEQNATFDAVLIAHDPNAKPIPPKGETEQLLDALIAEGVVPAAKRQALAQRMRAAKL